MFEIVHVSGFTRVNRVLSAFAWLKLGVGFYYCVIFHHATATCSSKMATEESGRARLKERFYEVFNELVSSKSANSFYFNNEQYQEMLESVKLAKNAKNKSTLQYRRLKRFDICSIRGIEKLISGVSSGESSIKYYVTNDEMFDILHDAHLAIGHGGKHRMESECKKKYKNVTQDVIKLYLRLCEGCQKKT